MITFEKFKDLLSEYRAFSKYENDCYKIGFEFFETKAAEAFYKLFKFIVTEHFGDYAYDTITYALDELPDILKKKPNEPYMWDENDNPIDISTDDKLYKYLVSAVEEEKENN